MLRFADMRCAFLLAATACAFACADQTSDSLNDVFSAIGGLNTCYAPCVGDLIFAARELLFFKDTVDKFKDLCHTYDSAQLCVATKELQCMQTSSFAVDASGIEELCDDKNQQFQQQLPCLQKNIDNILDECNSDCWFTPALADLANKDIVGDASSTQADANATLGKDFEELCPATTCFVSCLAREIDASCPPAGLEITSAILRPFFIDAGLLELSDPDQVAASIADLPDSCKPLLDSFALANMTRGTFQVDPATLEKLQATLSASNIVEDDTAATTSAPATTTTEEATFRASAPRPVPIVVPRPVPIVRPAPVFGPVPVVRPAPVFQPIPIIRPVPIVRRPIPFFRPPFGRRFHGRFGHHNRFPFRRHH